MLLVWILWWHNNGGINMLGFEGIRLKRGKGSCNLFSFNSLLFFSHPLLINWLKQPGYDNMTG